MAAARRTAQTKRLTLRAEFSMSGRKLTKIMSIGKHIALKLSTSILSTLGITVYLTNPSTITNVTESVRTLHHTII
jgi:hypothetical protein